MPQTKDYYLSKRWTTFIFVYYLFLFFFGLALSLLAILPFEIAVERNINTLSLCGGIGMALNGGSIYYIRKLYKLCFSANLITDNNSSNYIKKLGSIVYFMTRPFFSVAFAVLVFIGIQSGFMVTSAKPIELNNGFIYLVMFFSFFLGFSAGNFIKKLEKSSNGVLNKLGDNNGE